MIVKHLFAVLVLPVTVVIVIPFWILRGSAMALVLPATAPAWAAWLAGFPVLAAGAALFATSLRRFAQDGQGTLAPWDPPIRLVVRGPYAYVRNPMISGVVLLLVSEALFLRSAPHLSWAVLFFLINATYIPLFEEPALRARFGRAYDEYAGSVPRLVPRLTPWKPDA